MNAIRSLALLLPSALALISCGGGGSSGSSTPAVPAAPTDAQRAAAATATASTNVTCSAATLGPYYWEIGDANGAKVSGTVGAGAPGAGTVMWVFSSSKWLYAANVLQKHGVAQADVPYLNFTSGYSLYGNPPLCGRGPGADTVQGCVPPGGLLTQDPTTIGRFAYDSGHMQHHAVALMGLGAANDAALAADLNATVGSFGFTYSLPQLAAGVNVAPQGYAAFLRRLLRGELTMAGALGTQKVCASTTAAGCNAAFTPEEMPATEAWNYSLGHWVEDDPVVGDHAFSSAGGGGFYPWIDSSKSYYGILARETERESGAGVHSALCGRLIRQAWRTGVALAAGATLPTP